MSLKRSTRARKSMAAKRSTPARRSNRAKRSLMMWSFNPDRYSGPMVAAATFLVVIGIVAAAMAVGPRQQSSQSAAQIAARDLRTDEPITAQPLAPQADPKRVPDAKSVAEDAAAAASLADTAAQASPIVTITGCLERDDEAFRLKDTSGEAAPRSRSWKSGFLRKSPATIDVVDGANRVKLPDHVGERVSVTGHLTDRAMAVRSIQRISSSCRMPRA